MKNRHFSTVSLEHIEKRIYEVSDGKYTALDLSNEYASGLSKITLHCSEHDVVWKAAIEKIYRGSGCPQCAKEKQVKRLTLSIEDKVSQIVSVVGEGVYDFSKVPLDATVKDNVTIRCVKHNEYFIKPLTKLLRSKGCKKCVHESRMKSYNRKRMNQIKELPYTLLTDSWVNVKRKSDDHKTLYPVQCKNCNHKFGLSWARLFASQNLCVACGNGLVQSLEDFKVKVSYRRDASKPSYNLDQFEYTGYDQPSKIVCEEHGFCQNMSARSIIDGRIMHCCWIASHHGGWNFSRLDEEMKNKDALLYHLRFTSKYGKVFDKVGITTKSLQARFWAVEKMGFTYEVVRICEDTLYDCMILEHIIKESLKADDRMYRVHDFKHKSIGGWTECFYPITKEGETLCHNAQHD